MATNKDISLTIRAKTEGERALQSLAGVLENVLGSMGKVGTAGNTAGQGLGALVGDLASLDKAFGTISKAADTAGQAFDRQNKSLLESRAQLEALKAQAAAAATVVERLDRVKAAAGGSLTEGREGQLKGAKAEFDRLQTAIARTGTEIGRLQSGLGSSLTAMQQLGSQSLAVAEAQARARTQIEQTTAAIQAQERAASVQPRVNAVTGITATRATAAGAGYEQLAKLAAQQEAAQLASARAEGERLRSAINTNTGVSGTRATDAGATFSALAAREESIALKAAADAHAMFEARVRQGVQAMRQHETAQQDDTAAVARLRSVIDPLGTAQARYNTQLAETRRLHQAGKISAEELAAAEKHLADEMARTSKAQGNKPKVSLFGLQPYETQNLFYQINDVFTQLGSGTSLTQTLSQQGGQIFQLFQNRIGPAIAGMLPGLLAAGAAMGTFAVAISHANAEAERLRSLKGALDVSADGGLYDAAKLEASAKALRSYGISADEAVASFKTLIQEGIREDKLVQFTKAAQDLSDVMGLKLPEATRTVGEAFSAGYDSIAKLDDAYNFLSETQREHIRTLFEEGRAGDARTEALQIFSDKMNRAATDMRGPWAEASRSLSGAWNALLDKIANSSPIVGATNAFTALAITLKNVLDLLSGGRTRDTILGEIGQKTQQIAALKKQLEGKPNDNYLKTQLGDAQRGLASLQRELGPGATAGAAAGSAIAAANGSGGGDTINGSKQNKQTNDRISELTDEQELVKLQEKAQKGLTQAEIARRGVLAGNIAARKEELSTGNAVLAQKMREIAAEKELKQAREQQVSAVKRNEADAKEQNRKFAEDIKQGRRADLIGTASRYEGMNERSNSSSLTDFFKTAGISINPNQTAWCAAFVSAVLASNSLPTPKVPGTNTPSLAARSFLNYGTDSSSDPQKGDIVVLRRGQNDSQGHVGFFQGFDGTGNPMVLGGNQGNGVNTRTFSKDDVLGFRRAPTAAQAEKEQDARLKQQQEMGAAIDRETSERKKNADQLKIEGDLTGTALLNEQKKAAVLEAQRKVREEYAKAAEKGIIVDPKEIDAKVAARGAAVGAEFDASHQKQYVQSNVDEVSNKRGLEALSAQRDQIQQQIDLAQKMGDGAGVQSLQNQLAGVNEQLVKMAENALAAMANLSGPEAEAARAKLQQIRTGATQSKTEFIATGRALNEQFANGVAGAVDRFAQSVAQGKNVFKSLKEAFLQFASDFLKQIAQMIIKQAIFNAIGGASQGGGGGIGGAISSALTKLFHTGGIAGGPSQSRAVSPAVFAGAMRYHTGGIAGLAADEVPAVLRKGEEVLTTANPRHRNNVGKGGSGAPNIKIVNAVDGSEALNHALNQKSGEQVLLNFMRNNSGAIKAAIG